MYERCKIYGPYTSKKDGRMRLVIIREDNTRTTLSYPKYLMEMHLGRYLTKDESVDHIDCNVQNNEISNLRVLYHRDHVLLDVKRHAAQSFKCPTCQGNFSLDGIKMSHAISNRKRGSAGPFCSKSCAGRYSQRIQKGQVPSDMLLIIPFYTTLKEQQSLHGETHEVDIAKTVKS